MAIEMRKESIDTGMGSQYEFDRVDACGTII